MRVLLAADDVHAPRAAVTIQSLFDQGHRDVVLYDLGMTKDRNLGVEVRQVPDELKVRVDIHGRMIPGAYRWKWWALHHDMANSAHDVFWLDAGHLVLKSLEPIMAWAHEHGPWAAAYPGLAGFITDRIATVLRLPQDYSKKMATWPILLAGQLAIPGPWLHSLIVPMWYMAERSPAAFEDNGTARGGPSAGRGDEAILSIVMGRLGLGDRLCSLAMSNHFHLALHEKTSVCKGTYIVTARHNAEAWYKELRG